MKQRIGYLFLSFLLVAALEASGEECRIVQKNAGGTYDIQIGSSSFKTVSDQQMREFLKMEQELKAEQDRSRIQSEEIASLKKINEQLEQGTKERDEMLKKNKELTEKLEATNKACEDLVKICCARNRVTLTGGIGLTTEADPAVLIGIGYNDFRLWGMFEKDVKAGIVGMDWQVFSW